MPAAPMPPAWEVTGQAERLMPMPDGRTVSGVVISFRTRGGNTGSVFVPDNQYTPDAVAAAVSARAATMDGIGALKG